MIGGLIHFVQSLVAGTSEPVDDVLLLDEPVTEGVVFSVSGEPITNWPGHPAWDDDPSGKAE